ncbi:class II fructose-bisphosphate aldolase [Pararhizobium antarcticum]|uniref:Fructose-1,6-bisphosphate aldolase n=1 Tax=Pararhizobium antarcticum TaxID=1798805 RepID=A0A657LML1_9HYPH|nr:class II fructose-bisphosphate aldolase [Pararhizobium antarcticum]OJF91313.1 fructose-1,6-bisphosphate aldolase [Pararhizobium antarcticum]OJG01220.1 fructose-1,6-bisphosphate aldolase [Rhizobium sp. 58]
MALITLRQLLDHAAENAYALPAFNVNNLEYIQAVMRAADATDSPVILQASRGARAYAGDAFLRHLILGAAEEYPHIPVCLHLDHGDQPSTCISAITNGFTSVMMDGSLQADGKTIASYDYNVAVTAEVVKIAHAAGVSVEGELGCLGNLETGAGEKEDGHGFEGKLSREELLTDPEQAFDFVEKTGVDALAVAIGTSHGAYKFTRAPDGEILSIETIAKIHKRLPNTHMVMHGSSSVPQELQDLFTANGGKMKQTWGVPVSEIQKAIPLGVRKVNIDTDLRLAFTGMIRKHHLENPDNFDPRNYLKPATALMVEVCKERFIAFNTAGQASKIRVKRLPDMAKGYSKAA